MQNIGSVHVLSPFLLIYQIEEGRKAVFVLDYGHHDRIYKG